MIYDLLTKINKQNIHYFIVVIVNLIGKKMVILKKIFVEDRGDHIKIILKNPTSLSWIIVSMAERWRL